jgi:hypothetical protein
MRIGLTMNTYGLELKVHAHIFPMQGRLLAAAQADVQERAMNYRASINAA